MQDLFHRPSIARFGRRLSVVSGALLVCLAVVVPAEACPSCKSALATSGQGDLVGGFMWSILFMLSMPFACVAGFSTYMYVLVQRARAEEAADKLAENSAPPTTNDSPGT